MLNKDFNRYAEEMLDVHVFGRTCPQCKREIKDEDIQWLGNEEMDALTCIHLMCGMVFRYNPDGEYFFPIGSTHEEGTIAF